MLYLGGFMFAEVADAVRVSDVMSAMQMFCTLIGTMFAGYITYLIAKLNKQGEVDAKEAKKVKEALGIEDERKSTKIDEIAKVARDTHTLVNSNMAVQLKLNAELSRWKAEQTKDPADAEAADTAERLYREHQAKQAIVDAGTVAVPATGDSAS